MNRFKHSWNRIGYGGNSLVNRLRFLIDFCSDYLPGFVQDDWFINLRQIDSPASHEKKKRGKFLSP